MTDPRSYGRAAPRTFGRKAEKQETRAEYEERMVREERQRVEWVSFLTAAQRNEFDQMDDGTWEPDRNG